MFRPGTSEIVAGRAIASGFRGAGIGETVRFASRDWTVVGMFDAGRTGFNSEIWGDAEQMLQAFRRAGYLVDDLPARRRRPLRHRQARDRSRSATHARSEARAAVLRGPVGGARQVHHLPRPDDLGHLLDRRHHRRDDHDVRERRVAHRRDRHAARARLLAQRDPRSRSWSSRCCSGSSAVSSGSSRASFMQAIPISTMNFQTFAELAFTFTLTPAIVVASLGVRAGHGVRRRLPAGGARGAAVDRRRAARCVTRASRMPRRALAAPLSRRARLPAARRMRLARMRFVQLDPIRAPARAADLILRHRVDGLPRGRPRPRVPGARPRRGLPPRLRRHAAPHARCCCIREATRALPRRARASAARVARARPHRARGETHPRDLARLGTPSHHQRLGQRLGRDDARARSVCTSAASSASRAARRHQGLRARARVPRALARGTRARAAAAAARPLRAAARARRFRQLARHGDRELACRRRSAPARSTAFAQRPRRRAHDRRRRRRGCGRRASRSRRKSATACGCSRRSIRWSGIAAASRISGAGSTGSRPTRRPRSASSATTRCRCCGATASIGWANADRRREGYAASSRTSSAQAPRDAAFRRELDAEVERAAPLRRRGAAEPPMTSMQRAGALRHPTAIWGSTWLAITFQLGAVAPEVSVAYRFALAQRDSRGVVRGDGRSLAFPRREHAWLVGVGRDVLRPQLHRRLLGRALRRIGPRRRRVLDHRVHEPDRHARVLRRTPLTPRTLVAATLGVAGVALLFLPELAAARQGGIAGARDRARARRDRDRDGRQPRRGAQPRAPGCRSLPATAWGMVYGARTARSPRSRACRGRFERTAATSLSLLYLALFGSVVAFGAYLTLLKRVGAGPSSFVGVATPVIAIAAVDAVRGLPLDVGRAWASCSRCRQLVLALRGRSRRLLEGQPRLDDQLLPVREVALDERRRASAGSPGSARRLRARAARGRRAARARFCTSALIRDDRLARRAGGRDDAPVVDRPRRSRRLVPASSARRASAGCASRRSPRARARACPRRAAASPGSTRSSPGACRRAGPWSRRRCRGRARARPSCRARHEELEREMVDAAGAGRAVVELAGLAARERRRTRASSSPGASVLTTNASGPDGDRRDRRELRDRVVAGVARRRGDRRERRGDEQQRVAVAARPSRPPPRRSRRRRRSGCRRRPTGRARSRQLLRDVAGDRVGARARRERDDQPDRLGRVLRRCRGGAKGEGDGGEAAWRSSWAAGRETRKNKSLG